MRREFQTLFDLANAEAKRIGDDRAGALHLAAVLQKREAESFRGIVAEESRQALRARLDSGSGLVAGDELEEFFRRVKGNETEDVIRQLDSELPGLLERASEYVETEAERPPKNRSTSVGTRSVQSSSRHLAAVEADSAIVGHEETVDRMLAQLARRSAPNVLVHGPAGSGKTASILQFAARISAPGYEGPLAGRSMRAVNVSQVLADDPVAALDSALDLVGEEEILVVDDLETLLGLGAQSVFGLMLLRLKAALADPKQRVVLVVDEKYRDRLSVIDPELYEHLSSVSTAPLSTDRIREIARQHAKDLADHHGVTIDDDVVLLSVAPASERDTLSHPGLAVSRLEGAASYAAIRPDRVVIDGDLSIAGDVPVAAVDAKALVSALRKRVRGQDHVLERVSTRLALTRANLDIRPERPDSVFLFVGPTGVGKTELAKALCSEVFEDDSRLIRLDMSEYAESWSLSRLIGPQAGYVGSDQPSGWLTTRVAAQPNSLILLDEIEKADPAVWNAFLQVFDAGRLSDSRGTVADFSNTIVIMTSNIGASAFTATPFGFADEASDDEIRELGRESVLDEIHRRMAPELINRLDEILVFEPLGKSDIAEIAAVEIARLKEKLDSRGFEVEFSADVTRLVAETGYDPAYGARHLQRNLEKLLLEPLTNATHRKVSATTEDGSIVWSQLD